MGRANPFDPNDGCGDGQLNVNADGLVGYGLQPMGTQPHHRKASYLRSQGRTNMPAATVLKTF